MFKKNKIFALGLYDEKFIYAQDYKLIKDIYKSNYKIKYLYKTLYETRRPANSIENLRKKEQEEFADNLKIHKRIYNKFFKFWLKSFK